MAFPIDKNASRSGQTNSAGDARDLYLKLFAGEVLTTFREENISLGLTRVKVLTTGKSHSFPILGKNAATYHKAGQLIDTNKIPHTERLVTIDDIAISPVFIPDIDEVLQHYDTRAPYSLECAESLAGLIDRNIFRMIAKAAAITSQSLATAAGLKTIADEPYTANITLAVAGDELVGAKIVNAIFKARTQFRLANIKEKPVVVLRPEQYEALVNVQDVSLVTWMNKDVGGVGSMSEGVIPRVAGLSIYESTNMPRTNQTATTGDAEPISIADGGSGNTEKYRGNFAKLVGLVFSPSAVATVQAMDVTTDVIPEPLRLGTNILGKLLCGHNILRPCCAVAIYSF
jgi:hypothetical protein